MKSLRFALLLATVALPACQVGYVPGYVPQGTAYGYGYSNRGYGYVPGYVPQGTPYGAGFRY